MIRLFDEHKRRPVRSLDGLWTLRTPKGDFTAHVPGVWERIPALTTYRGEATYSRAVSVPEGGDILLKFGGVSHTADVLWDGVPVAHHYNAFTGFEALIEAVPAGEHTLEVRVDNSFSEKSTLHIPNDYFTYGGISRPVELHNVNHAFIERTAFHAVENGPDRFTAHVRAWVRALEDVDAAFLTVMLAGARASVPVPTMKKGETVCVALDMEVSGVRRWDVLDSHLYDLAATLSVNGMIIDDLIDSVGFRTVELRGEKICLNGREVFLKGFNRHEDHGQFGCALSVDAMMDDLQLALDMGANSIRTCHYPNDPRFLDLCDELGILVWEEHHARALPHDVMATPLFAEQTAACNEEMIAQHVNHPCIYVWGVLNECESETEFGRAIYERNLKHLRALDPTRPVTFASCRYFKDICLDLVDIVSFNIYPGWYIREDIRAFTERLIGWMEQVGAAGKPIIISEIGAGGIAGYHDPFGEAKWSEERQASIIEDQLAVMTTMPRLSGVYVWQFADVRVAEEWAMSRPKTVNNKGVVDMYRRPKMSYAVVKRAFRNTPGTR